jgi:hypothetical protein
VTLNTVLITDLFPDEGLFGGDESGKYSLNGSSSFNSFSSAGASGLLTLAINQGGVTSIEFKSNTDLISDFSVRGLTYSTPEPSSLLLLGCVMMLLAFSVKRFSARSY